MMGILGGLSPLTVFLAVLGGDHNLPEELQDNGSYKNLYTLGRTPGDL